ncbi:MAG: DUF2085 domain-containing protein [Vicinamibacterales bacterium]
MAALLTASAAVWAMIILIAPVALHRASTARPGTLVYAVSSRICHQRTERSFAIGGVQMPVCARCSGLYLAGATGALIAWFRRAGRSTLDTRTLLLISAVPTALTFALEWLGIMPFSNTARAVAAMPLGASTGWVFVCMLRYDARFDGNKNFNR